FVEAPAGSRFQDRQTCCEPTSPLFLSRHGGRFTPYGLRESWYTTSTRAGCRDRRFHDLRHTCATLLLLANVHPKVVSERLGHASIQITLDTYSHLLPTMQSTAVAALTAALVRVQ